MSQLDARREELRARQGAGARYDAPEAPAEVLGLARRGTAHFARLLNGLSDRDLAAPIKGLPTRAHLVAQISLQARRMSETLSALRKGQAQMKHDFIMIERPTLDQTASLPTRALRNLFAHSEVHLNVEFRDLGAEDWQAELLSSDSTVVPVATVPYLRAVSLWRTSLLLDAHGSVSECPLQLRADVIAPDTDASLVRIL
jgi:maleylpyruvate isomerase